MNKTNSSTSNTFWSRIQHVITVIASAVALLVPLLYIVGFGFDQGYLNGYGVSTEFFPRAFEEYLMFSFYSLVLVAVKIFGPEHTFWSALQGASIIVGVAALILVILIKRKADARLAEAAKTAKEHWTFDYVFFPAVAWLGGVLVPFAMVFAIAVFFIMLTFGAALGHNHAEKEIESFSACTIANGSDCLSVYDGGNVVTKGRLVARSSTHIAVYDGQTTTILPIDKQVVKINRAKK